MITVLLILGLITSLGLNVAGFILINRLGQKNDIYQSWIVDARDDIEGALNLMREIDKQGTFATSLNDKGIFESTDEIGQVFKNLEEVVENLNERIQ